MATLTPARPARTWDKVLDDLAELIERRRVCATDLPQYLETFCDDRPAIDRAAFRELELEDLDEQIAYLLAETRRLAGVTA